MDRFKKSLSAYSKAKKDSKQGSNPDAAELQNDQSALDGQEEVPIPTVRKAVFPSFGESPTQTQKPGQSPPSSNGIKDQRIRQDPVSALSSNQSSNNQGMPRPTPPKENRNPQNPPGLLKTQKEKSLRRVAKFLILLGKNEAIKVVRHLSPQEVEAIGKEIATISHVDTSEAEEILHDFGYITGRLPGNLEGGVDVAKDILVSAFGQSQALKVLEKARKSNTAKPFEFLNRLSPSQLSQVLESESPMVLALVIPYLESKAAAGFLQGLPRDNQLFLIKRLSKLEKVGQEVLEQVENRLQEKADTLDETVHPEVSGKSALLGILRHVDLKTEESLLAALEDSDGDLATELRENIFTLEKLQYIPDENLADYLRGYTETDLAFFLKGKGSEVRIKIEACLSSRRRKILLDEETIVPKIPKSEVDKLTRDFLSDLRTKVQNGEIPLMDKPEEYI